MEKQLIELQEMLAHQQLSLDKMSAEMYAQQKEIAQLQAQVKHLREQATQSGGQESDGSQGGYEPPPPHY